MKLTDDPIYLNASIFSARARLSVLEYNINVLYKEQNIVTALKTHLELNLSTLKQKGIITTASEFYKTRKDLSTAVKRLSSINLDIKVLEKAKNETLGYIKELEKHLVAITNRKNNVIEANFGKNTKQK